MVAVCVAAASMVGCAGARGDGQLVLGAQNQCEGALEISADGSPWVVVGADDWAEVGRVPSRGTFQIEARPVGDEDGVVSATVTASQLIQVRGGRLDVLVDFVDAACTDVLGSP